MSAIRKSSGPVDNQQEDGIAYSCWLSSGGRRECISWRGVAGDVGFDGVENAGGDGASARIRNCPAHPASFQRSSEAESGNPLSCAAATGATWMGTLQVGRVAQ